MTRHAPLSLIPDISGGKYQSSPTRFQISSSMLGITLMSQQIMRAIKSEQANQQSSEKTHIFFSEK
jgi:CRISPR/Cas system type I-B associated protein Csh2 (Cas7 group RAMP superfamily)